MIHHSYIFAPLVGGVIGYVTNALAIKMLFRPYTAKYLFGYKIPFTPGIIPKEKGRIAASLGTAISENLMSNEMLEKYLLSEDMISKISQTLDDFIAEQQKNEETLQEFLMHYLFESDYETASQSLKSQLTAQVAQKLGDSSLGTQIADVVVDHVVSKMRLDGLGINIGDLFGKNIGGRIAGMAGNIFGGSIFNKIADLIQAPLKNMLAKNINSILKDKGADMVNTVLTNEIDKIENTQVKVLLENHEKEVDQAKQTIMGLYRKIISDQLPKILSTINIPAIIESRINEMDMKETEQLIFKVMDKELKAIIWLGALLGLVMGCVNLLELIFKKSI